MYLLRSQANTKMNVFRPGETVKIQESRRIFNKRLGAQFYIINVASREIVNTYLNI